ncbi:tyrosine-type recombinase/integrase [Streptomyces sp. CA-181903]|uniref:tyrosine-type recombinase/integrase n=1 Tax=Streptomyces sp. CA-181903 TaxID=3240055 RepID=UPI003D949BE5
MLVMVCGGVLRPDYHWLRRQQPRALFRLARIHLDAEGFEEVDEHCSSSSHISEASWRYATTRLTWIIIRKGGRLRDITVGDCLELYELLRRSEARTAGRTLFYEILRDLGVFPEGAPHTLFYFRTRGQLTVPELVDQYEIACRPIRDLFVDYLSERQAALDYASLKSLARTLCSSFWKDIEAHHPGIDSLALSAEHATAWKQRIQRIWDKDGRPIRDRVATDEVLLPVRAFYLDLAQWAAEDPARWALWVTPSPVRESDLAGYGKRRKARKARMDQRTRERLPVLPSLVSAAERRRKEAQEQLRLAREGGEGTLVSIDGEILRVLGVKKKSSGHVFAVSEISGRRRDLTIAEERAFFAWAAIEVLRHTGIRFEELTELTHHSFVSYRLPATGEVVPLLQVAPSKTDMERLLLVSPELGEVLAELIFRVREGREALPLVSAFDIHEETWSSPMPILFQWRRGSQSKAISRSALRELVNDVLRVSGLTDAQGRPLTFTPHDFRRLFVTDAILNGLPPHIAQVVCGHQDIGTTMGYKAIYPEEAIEAHRAFIARRRATRPGDEYRTLTDGEWEEFLGHFERRKVSVGNCARAFGTPCIHEHACVRCPMLQPDIKQRARLVEIRHNLLARIEEAEREGWLGEVEGLHVSLSGATEKIEQLDASAVRQSSIDLGMPGFREVTGRGSS